MPSASTGSRLLKIDPKAAAAHRAWSDLCGSWASGEQTAQPRRALPADHWVCQKNGRNPISSPCACRCLSIQFHRLENPLSRQISEKAFSRMQSERAREAAEYRAKGSETARMITATADRDVVVLRGNAQRQADQTRDEGDAERNRTFAEAYGRTRISLPSIARCNRGRRSRGCRLPGSPARILTMRSARLSRTLSVMFASPSTLR